MPGQNRKIAKGKRRRKKSNQLLEFTDKKSIPEQLILKEKPKFDMSFLADNGSSLISRCNGFLDNVPTSSTGFYRIFISLFIKIQFFFKF